jgi:hypothetical protein
MKLHANAKLTPQGRAADPLEWTQGYAALTVSCSYSAGVRCPSRVW